MYKHSPACALRALAFAQPHIAATLPSSPQRCPNERESDEQSTDKARTACSAKTNTKQLLHRQHALLVARVPRRALNLAHLQRLVVCKGLRQFGTKKDGHLTVRVTPPTRERVGWRMANSKALGPTAAHDGQHNDVEIGAVASEPAVITSICRSSHITRTAMHSSPQSTEPYSIDAAQGNSLTHAIADDAAPMTSHLPNSTAAPSAASKRTMRDERVEFATTRIKAGAPPAGCGGEQRCAMRR